MFPSTTGHVEYGVHTRKTVDFSIKVGTKWDSLEGETGCMQVHANK